MLEGIRILQKKYFFREKYEMKRMAVWFLASKKRVYPLAHFSNMTNTYKECVKVYLYVYI